MLVTGATGMIGSSLTKALLDRDATVVALVRDDDPRSALVRGGLLPRVHTVNGALEDLAAVERAVVEHDVDTVFHLGAQTIVSVGDRAPLLTFEANIRGTYHVLECCRLHAASVQRVVVASSDKAYGASPDLPYREEMALGGRHPYEVSKSCADLLATAYAHTYDLPVTVARCGNVYGPGDLNWSRLVPGTIRALLRDEAPLIRSDGTFLRDYLYVDDIATAYLLLAERSAEDGIRGEAFNIGNDDPVSVLDVVALLRELMGRTDLEPVVLGGAQEEIRDQHLSAEKARDRLGWLPVHDLRAGLPPTIDWYRALLN